MYIFVNPKNFIVAGTPDLYHIPTFDEDPDADIFLPPGKRQSTSALLSKRKDAIKARAKKRKDTGTALKQMHEFRHRLLKSILLGSSPYPQST